MATKKIAKGKALYANTGSGLVLVPSMKDLPFNLGSYDEVEVTTHDAATNDREFLPTWKGQNSATFTGLWDPANTVHNWFLTNHGSATEQSFAMRYNTATPRIITFTAKIIGLEIPDDLNGSLDFSITLGSIKITSTNGADPA